MAFLSDSRRCGKFPANPENRDKTSFAGSAAGRNRMEPGPWTGPEAGLKPMGLNRRQF